MILFFGNPSDIVYAVEADAPLSESDQSKLSWLFGGQPRIGADRLDGQFVGPRAAMVSPWSTNAVEITQNMGIAGIRRIEQYGPVTDYDPDRKSVV